MIKMRIVGPALALTLAAALLAACGGGGTDTTPRAKITAVKSFGDSLADVGAIKGIRYTVKDNPVFPELIGDLYGVGRNCNYYVGAGDEKGDAPTSVTFTTNTKAGCSNYAIGGGRIDATGKGYFDTDPRTVGNQLAEATKASNFSSGDLLLIGGGGNDAADLTGAFLVLQTEGPTKYLTLLNKRLSQDQVNAAIAAGAPGLAAAGGMYMVALADHFYKQIKESALDKGAQRILLINMPDITNTPRFQMVLAGVEAASNAQTRAQTQGLIGSWVSAFNSRLAANAANESRIAVVDLYSNLNDQVVNPSQYNLTNAKTPVCPITGIGKDKLPEYDFPTCTDVALAALAPTGQSSDWYKSYLFSDGFHPTPYGHQLASQLLARSLAQKGWL